MRNEVKNEQVGAFIGLWGGLVARRTLLGHRVNSAHLERPLGSIDPVILQKKKKNLFLSQSSESCPENISEVAAVDRSSQVKFGLDP